MIEINSVKKVYLKSRNLSEEKNPPRAQIFRYYRYESRNNKKKVIILSCRNINLGQAIF